MKEVKNMELFVLGLVSAFLVTFVTASATTIAKRLFGGTQKPLPNDATNVNEVVIYVFIIM